MNNNNNTRANRLANIQTSMANKTTASNPTTVITPNTPDTTRPAINRSGTNLNLKMAQQPVQTRLDNLNAQTLPTTTGAWTVTGITTPTQSRFIWFQQQPQWMSFNKLTNWGYTYIPTSETKAETLNRKEENKFRTTSQALMDFQGDVLKNGGKMTERQMKTRYPEFADKIDVLKELQTELRPIVQSGMWVDAEQLAQYYPELLEEKKTVDVNKVKEKSDLTNKQYQGLEKRVNKVLKTNYKGLSADGLRIVRDADILFQYKNDLKKQWVVGWANDAEIIKYLTDTNPELKKIWDEMQSLELSANDKAILWTEGVNLLLLWKALTIEGLWDKIRTIKWESLDDKEKASFEEVESTIRAKELLESDFANQTWQKIATEINVPLDSLEKFAYRTYKDIQNLVLEKGSDFSKKYISNKIKSAFKKWLWVNLTDEQTDAIKNLYDKAVTPSIEQEVKTNQQNVMNYAESVNKEYESKKAANLNPDIENYTSDMSMTSSLLNWNRREFLYKSSWEAAQNAEMPLMVLAWTVAPEVVLPLMTLDSYSRESQESFEELMEVQERMGIPQDQAYSNAQEWSAIVWIASAAVEVWLEKLIGWVETTASKAFHDLIMKDFAEKATKMVAERGLVDLLRQWLTTQFKASFEEWLEEIVQQWIHNKAIQKYDPDHKLTEWLTESFEWGFFNWMNLLGWGWDIINNFNANKSTITQNANQTAYNLWERARNVVDNLNQWAYNAGANTRNILDNVRNRVTTQNTQENQTNNATEKESKPWVVERITDRWAEKITSTASAQDKLYKAQEPRMNVLSNKKNLEKRRANSDRANELIVENGYTPTNTSERLDAHQNTLNKLWGQVKDQVNQWKWIVVDQTPIVDALSKYIAEKKALNIAWIESDLNALEKELDSMKKSQKAGKTDLPILENKKQVFNDIVDWKGQEASEVYKWGIKLITSEIWKIEDAMISNIPWEFSNLKKDVGALLDSYEDVFKADMKNQRSKWLWLAETYSRIEWVWDIIEWLVGIFSWDWGKVIKWAWKILLWKSLAKAKDVDFLIKNGFEELSKQMKQKNNQNNGWGTTTDNNTTPPTNPTTPTNSTDNTKNKVTNKKTTKKSESKNKVTEKSTKSVDKNVSNQYNTTDASSNTSSVSLTEKEKKATWTKSVVSEQRQGAEIQEDIPSAFSNKSKTSTKWSNFDISWVEKEYSDNYDKIISWEWDNLAVWKIDWSIAFDGKERPAIFSQAIRDKINKDHSLDKQNLLWTIDKPDYIIKDFDKAKNPDKDKINLIRKIPWTNNFVLVAAERQNWFFILTNYEIHRNTENKMMKEIKWYAKRWIIALDTIWDLTEALKEQPKNKVTSKKAEATAPKQETKPQDSGRITAPKKERQIIKNDKWENEIVYHGTNAKFDKFDKNFIGRWWGFRFTTSKGEAEGYGKNVKEYNLMASNIMDFDSPEFDDLATQIIKQYTREKFGEEFYISPEAFIQDEWLRNYAQELGYDALKFSKWWDTKYIVYNEDQTIPVQKQPKAKATKTPKNKVTNPSKAKTTSLFNENEVDKGNKSEWLNPDALPLSDYREMQRLNDGYSLTSLSSALSKESLKDYMANKIANEKVWIKPDPDDNEAWDKLPEDFEDDWEIVALDIEYMYDAYEEYSDMKNGGDFDENTLKNTLESANDYANRQFPWKTAKEVIEQYTPEYESDLKIYNRLSKKYPWLANRKIDLTWTEGRARREFANQENETAQDIDYQDLAEMSNETAQIPTIFEEDLQESNIKNLEDNETAQTTEEEMNKVTKKEVNKPKNLVTSRAAESSTSNNTRYNEIRDYYQNLIDEDKQKIEKRKANPIDNNEAHIKIIEDRIKSYEDAIALWDDLVEVDAIWQQLADKINQNLKWVKWGWTKYMPVKESKYIDNNDGSKVKYLTTTKWDTTQGGLIEVINPQWAKETFVVQKIGNWPREVRINWKYMGKAAAQNLLDITNWEYKSFQWEENTEDYEVEKDTSKSPKEQFIEYERSTYMEKNPYVKENISREQIEKELDKIVKWTDPITDVEYKWTNAQRIQFYVDNPQTTLEQDDTYSARRYAKTITPYGENMQFLYWIEWDYARFLEANPDIREKTTPRPEGIRDAIEKWNEIHEKVVEEAAWQKEGTPLNSDKYIWQQPTAEQWIDAVYNETKKISDFFDLNRKAREWTITEEEKQSYNTVKKDAQNALRSKLQFKSDRSKLYQDYIQNIKDANWNEKQLRSIANNLYIQKVKDDFKNNYNYPAEVTDKVPWLRTAKDNYERYLKWRDTSFSGKDPRIDYSDKDEIWAWIKRQDWKQITAEQRREIVNWVLEYAKIMWVDMKKMGEDAGVTYVHLNWKHPFLTSHAVWLFHWLFKSISIWADMESYREKWEWRNAKTETHTVPVVMSHEITHAIDSMFEWALFSEEKTRDMRRKMNAASKLWDYWRRKEEITARMVEEYVDVMRGWEWYYTLPWYWSKEVFDAEVKPYVEQIFKEKFDWYRLSDKERDAIKLQEAPKSNNSVTATDLNKVTTNNKTENNKVITQEQADNIKKQWDKLWSDYGENTEYKNLLSEQFDEYSRDIKQIEEDTKNMKSDLDTRDEDNYTSSDYYYEDWADYEERVEQMEADIKANENTLTKVNEKYNEELREFIYSLPLDFETKEMLFNNISTEWSAWWKALDAFIKNDWDEADRMFKNIEWAYNRHQNTNYDLNRRNNDTSWMDEEQYDAYRKEFNKKVETDYSKTLKDYIKSSWNKKANK